MEKENNKMVSINEELNVVKYETENIKNLIYTIREKQVMLDSDVAMLYHCETRIINQAVKRNIERFPERYCFKLTRSEFENLRSQFVILNKSLNNENVMRKYVPYVFTEQGIAMLSGLLKNKIAVKVSINIIDAFVEMRKFIALNGQVFQEMNVIKGKLIEHDKKFDEVFNELQKNAKEEFKQKIFFDGQIYDAYSLIIDIIKSAKRKILIIDNYIDDSILKMLAKKNKNVEVVILTSQNCDISKLDLNKFNKQYPILKIAKNTKFHDRFIIIDDKELYHCGASLKDLGKKCFAISKIEDDEYIDKISNYS
ncbi:MAG: ORF6N domain-containing protein [Clostridia bacterium]